MGLFTGILTLPLSPVRGVVWVADQVSEEVDRQLYDEDRIRSELFQLELDAEEGKLDEEERQRAEDDLLERLAIAQARQVETADPWYDEPQAAQPEPAEARHDEPQTRRVETAAPRHDEEVVDG